MNLQLLRRFATQVLVVAAVLAAMATSGAPAQSLGDVARQEQARRKSTASTQSGGKVYTNDDLRGAPAPAATGSPSSAAPSALTPAATPGDKGDAAKPGDPNAKGADGQAPKADAKAAPDGKGDEASWRKRRQAIQDALDRANTFAEALQSRINGLTTDFASRDDPAQRSSVANDRQKALTELDRVKKEIAQHAKELDDLQDEARKNGVPSGWLR